MHADLVCDLLLARVGLLPDRASQSRPARPSRPGQLDRAGRWGLKTAGGSAHSERNRKGRATRYPSGFGKSRKRTLRGLPSVGRGARVRSMAKWRFRTKMKMRWPNPTSFDPDP